MKHDKFIIAANVLLLVVVAVLLLSCQPYMTYHELEEAAQTDPKAAKRLERFTKHAEDADEFISMVSYCADGSRCQMRCEWYGASPSSKNSSMHPERTEFENLDEKVRWYRRVRHSCRFISVDHW